AATAPTPEARRGELDSPVRDEMPGGGAGRGHRTIEEGAHLLRRWFLGENRDAHDAAREVIDDDGDPPAEGPDLRKSEGGPRNPEAEGGRYGREVDMPDVVRSAGRHHTIRGRRTRGRRLRSPRFAEHATDGGRAEVK